MIKWNKAALQSLIDIIDFLNENDFKEYAERLKNDILLIIDNLPKLHGKCRPDKYKIDNDGSLRRLNMKIIEFHLGLKRMK